MGNIRVESMKPTAQSPKVAMRKSGQLSGGPKLEEGYAMQRIRTPRLHQDEACHHIHMPQPHENMWRICVPTCDTQDYSRLQHVFYVFSFLFLVIIFVYHGSLGGSYS